MSIKFHNKTISREHFCPFFITEYQRNNRVCCEISYALLMKYQCWRPGPIIATAIVTHWLTHTTCGDLIGITPQMTLYGQICVMAITQFKLQCFDLSTVHNFTLCVHLSFIVEGETRECRVPRKYWSSQTIVQLTVESVHWRPLLIFVAGESENDFYFYWNGNW